MPPTAAIFREKLCKIFEDAERNGKLFVDVNAGELHRALGDYPGQNHRMPVCCEVMRGMLSEKSGTILEQPPKGYGASLTIRYNLSPLQNTQSEKKETEGPIDDAIYQRLKSVARNRETITYHALTPLKGLDMDNAADRSRIGDLLGEISTFEKRSGRHCCPKQFRIFYSQCLKPSI